MKEICSIWTSVLLSVRSNKFLFWHNSTLGKIQTSQPRSRVVEILEKEHVELKEIFTGAGYEA